MFQQALSIDFEDLAASVQFRNMSEILMHLTGLRLSLIDPELRRIKTLTDSVDKPLCSLIQSTGAGRNACRTDRAHCAAETAKTHNATTFCCHAGLHIIMVPIYIEGSHIANFLCEQILTIRPSERTWRQYSAMLKKTDIPLSHLKAAYMSMPYFKPMRLQAVTKLISLMAEYLREIGRRLKRGTPPSLGKITLARQHIETHFREPISTRDLAAHLNISPSYLSMMFRKYVGITMVAYIKQMRIDEARKLLGKPERNITEIAYAVGFNSLTHFNRSFREVVGCPPSEYRKRIAHLRNACLT